MRPFAALNSSSSNPTVDEAPILHVDLDAFFASVEVLDDPSLRGKPVAVGGAGDRGVIASASYEARRYGVRSAMPSVVARRACPELIILPGRFDRYEVYSRQFHEIVLDLTPDVEPLGLDEVFADLRSLRRLNVRPIEAAKELRRRINDELALRCGVGLGRNKLFAKLASKESKPRVVERGLVEGPGVFWVSPREGGGVARRAAGAIALGRRTRDRGEARPARAHPRARPRAPRRGDARPARRPRHGGRARCLRDRRGLPRGGVRSRDEVARSRSDLCALARGLAEIEEALKVHAGVVARALRG